MNRQLMAEDAGAELFKQGFDVRVNESDVVIELPGHEQGYMYSVIVSLDGRDIIQAWMWRKYGESEDETDHNSCFNVSTILPDSSPKEAGVKATLMTLRNLLSGHLEEVMAEHVEHVNEQADLGKGGMTEEEMASLGLLNIGAINMLDESVAKVDEALKAYEAR